MGLFILFLLSILIVRAIEFWFFLRKVNRVCTDYNWEHVDRHPELLIEMLETKDYKFKLDWSAHKFLFLEGPHPIKIFFSLKRLTLENVYDKDKIAKLKEYGVI